MTASDPKKLLVQLHKPAKRAKYDKHNTPKVRKSGKNVKPCTRCGRRGAHIAKYGIKVCRQCFREIALHIGFKKYR